MSSTFTPSTTIDMSKERDWPVNLGMLDWDNTSIVFTKRSLIEFLKYTGTTVDTNFGNISKLPRYAKFGKITDTSPDVQAYSDNSLETGTQSDKDKIIPSRRVRTVPGGPHTDIFAHGDEDDALSQAPPMEDAQTLGTNKAPAPATSQIAEEPEEQGINFPSSGIKPSRRVRENPGGNSSLANFWDTAEPTEFKPTRRVREGPGGRDSISDIF